MPEECAECGDAVPDGKLGMHYRIVHLPDPLYLYHDIPEDET